LIKLIADTFGVNPEYLKTGEGEMFANPAADEKTTKLVSLFKEFPPKYQEVIFSIIDVLQKMRDQE
jgi:hypothetical protein